MTMNYQMESSHVADYHLYVLPGVNYALRGPQCPLDAPTPSISFLGAAQTFGTFCKYPFPNLLGEMLSARIFNFGRGGAGPGFFSAQRAVLNYVNNTDCCVVQLMSARSSVHNTYMETVEGLTKVRMLKGSKAGQEILGHIAYRDLANELGSAEFYALVEDTRKTFVQQYKVLAQEISVPKVLIFVSRDAPLKDYAKDEEWNDHDLVGIHPHMVSEGVVAQVSEFFDDVILCYGRQGFDQRMVNRFTGEYVSIRRSQTYNVTKHNVYISPYLHTQTALKLYETLQKILSHPE